MLSKVEHIDYCERTNKPWGYEILWAKPESGAYVGKLMCIYPNKRMSLQYHEKKEETIYVMAGALKIWQSKSEGEYLILSPGNVYHVEPMQVHRFGAGDERVTLVDVSTNYLTDVVRLPDDYNR